MIYYICSANKKQIKKYAPLNQIIINELKLNDIFKIDIRFQKAIRIYYFYKKSKEAERLALKYIFKNIRYFKKILEIQNYISFNILNEFLNSNIQKNYSNFKKLVYNELDYDFEEKYEKSKGKEREKLTCLRKYGDENYNNSEKHKQTTLKRYGDENYFKTVSFKSKRLNTIKERYGLENWFETDDYKNKKNKIRNKIKTTKLKNHGDENYNNREKFKQTNLERYGLENYNNREKYKQTCLEKYGIKHLNQKHFKNIDNLNESYVKQNFIKDDRFLIQDFMDYFNIAYTQTLIYKRKFNISTQNKINIAKTQQFIFDSIKTENKVFNDRTVLNGKELDIYLPDIKLAIEYNGLLYHSEGYSEHKQFGNVDKNYHLDKTNQCLEKGITLFHIFEGEDLDLWLSMINNKLGLNERIFARKCYVAELKSKDIIKFLSDNHIQGYVQSSINLGLFYTDGVELPKLVSVMTFSKPRFNKHYEYELIRFCSLKNTSVIGGANKLLKYFINKYHPKSIISYANRRFSNGSIYETLGFKKIGTSGPNYFYFKDSSVLESRNKYQKHKLKSLLPEFDENLSESENMFKNGYRRIYDCGNLVYELVL